MTKRPMTKPAQRKCRACGDEFLARARHQPYCSLRCRFWSAVEKKGPNECWPWTKELNQAGYGRMRVEGKSRRASRISYELTFGAIPGGNDVCHSCDNRSCCNPAHLWVGTHRENMADMAAKDRSARATAKLNEEQVRQIFGDPRTKRAIASEYGIGQTTVYDIKTGKKWKHLNLL